MARPTSVRLDADVREYLEYLLEEHPDLSRNKLINMGLRNGLSGLDPLENPAMRYYKAREKYDENKEPSGVWHYTVMIDKQIVRARACYPDCPGHASPEEAYEHERARRISELRFDRKTTSWCSCAVEGCDNPTKTHAYVPGIKGCTFALCHEHLSHEFADPLVTAGESWES